MARSRDHAKEYAARKAAEARRAAAEGRAFSLKNVRGHGGLKAALKAAAAAPARAPAPVVKPPPAPPPARPKGRTGKRSADEILKQALARQKPLDQLSPAYRAKLERHGVKPGELRQKARGHAPGEHEARKAAAEKTTLTGQLSRGHKSALRAFFNKEIASRHRDEDDDELAERWETLLSWATSHGWPEVLRLFQSRRERIAMSKQANYLAATWAEMEWHAYNELDIPDATWLWYH